MDQQEIIARLEARAKAVDLPMYEVCRRAGIHATTFSRWKLSETNASPIGATLASLTKIEKALGEAEADREVAAAISEKAA